MVFRWQSSGMIKINDKHEASFSALSQSWPSVSHMCHHYSSGLIATEVILSDSGTRLPCPLLPVGHKTAQSLPKASRPFQKRFRRSIVICLPFWLKWDFMPVTSRSIMKADSVKFSIGVINLLQPQFPYLWSESNQDDNEELGQVRLAARHPLPAAT